MAMASSWCGMEERGAAEVASLGSVRTAASRGRLASAQFARMVVSHMGSAAFSCAVQGHACGVRRGVCAVLAGVGVGDSTGRTGERAHAEAPRCCELARESRRVPRGQSGRGDVHTVVGVWEVFVRGNKYGGRWLNGG